MSVKILNNEFNVVGIKERITVPDCNVVPNNKIGKGNGESKIYVGSRKDSNNVKFFGQCGFTLNCFLLKRDLIGYLEETKMEYLNPTQKYQKVNSLKHNWELRWNKISQLPEIIKFQLTDQVQLEGPRIYLNTKKQDKNSKQSYNLIRELSLPNISYISILKLENNSYYFRLFSEFGGETVHPNVLVEESKRVNHQIIEPETKKQIIDARDGQGVYRKKLLKECVYCPITKVSKEQMLIAGHIKPWVRSNHDEKIDVKNGFLFTPTYDRLFDQGFLSFTDDKKTILSPYLDMETYNKLGLSFGKPYPELPLKGRQDYLKYHRDNVLRK
ncbi:MAG: HNH endonuclease [Flavobacteriaceae bacterium]|nr:HNH endonuclease [Flavobacteriaceae bacterium]